MAAFDRADHWAVRHFGEPSVFDEDVAGALVRRAHLQPEDCFGLPRLLHVRATNTDDGKFWDAHVDGILVFGRDPLADAHGALRREAPLAVATAAVPRRGSRLGVGRRVGRAEPLHPAAYALAAAPPAEQLGGADRRLPGGRRRPQRGLLRRAGHPRRHKSGLADLSLASVAQQRRAAATSSSTPPSSSSSPTATARSTRPGAPAGAPTRTRSCTPSSITAAASARRSTPSTARRRRSSPRCSTCSTRSIRCTRSRRSSTADERPQLGPYCGTGRRLSRHHQGVLLRLPDPDARYSAVRLSSDLPAQDFARDNGEWRLEFDRAGRRAARVPARGRARRRRHRVRARPRQPEHARRARSATSRCCCSRPTSRPRGSTRPHVEGEMIDTHAGRAACRRRALEPRRRRPGRAAAAARRPRRARVRPALPAHALLRRQDRTRASCRRTASRCSPRASATSGTPRRRATRARSRTRCCRSCRPPTARPPRSAPASARSRCSTPQRRHPGTFGALFLQSGSFFMPRYDAHESRFPHYHRVVGFVSETLRGRSTAPTCPPCSPAAQRRRTSTTIA